VAMLLPGIGSLRRVTGRWTVPIDTLDYAVYGKFGSRTTVKRLQIIERDDVED